MVGGGHVHKCAPEKAKYAWKCISVCASDIFKHAADVWNIWPGVCAEHRSAMVPLLKCCHSKCVFSIWDGSVAADFQGTSAFVLVCLPHAQHFLIFYSFTPLSPKTENWSNFSFWMNKKKSFTPQFGLKTLTTEPREKTDWRWWEVADWYIQV